MNIGVIGIGKLGLCFALLCEKNGFHVIGSDINANYIANINTKTLKSNERGVVELLKHSKNFKATTSNEEVILNSDIIYTFVPTPSLPTGEYDHKYVDMVVDDIIKTSQKSSIQGKIFVIGCTTMPGYTDTVSQRLRPYGVHVCYNPEFIAQGEIIRGLEEADMVLLGNDSPAVVEKITSLYERIQTTPVKMNIMSNKAAEITKISINCFLTTKISYANMIGEVLTSSGLENEIQTVLTAIGDDKRIGKKYLGYGFGFGGPCLPRDNRALGVYSESLGLPLNIPKTIDAFNNEHHNYLLSYIMKKNQDKTIPFLIRQLTYKKGTDLLIESQQLKLVLDLLEEGYTVYAVESEEVIRQLAATAEKYEGRFILTTTSPDERYVEIDFDKKQSTGAPTIVLPA